MPSEHKDYSGTPLWRKLGISEGARVAIVGEPTGFRSQLEAMSPLPDGVTFLVRPGRDLDVVVLFVAKREDLARRFEPLTSRLAPAGRLWVAWPKKASGLPTDLSFGSVQQVGLGAGLVDNKSASITDELQGVQFVIRSADRKR